MLIDTQPSPIWRNTWNTLVADPPESRVLIQRRKFPAGIFELGNKGWLYHVCSFWHFWLMQVVLIMTSVPFSLASTSGLSALQIVQNLKSSSNFVKKTMCFGSDLRFEPFSGNLQKNNHVIKNLYYPIALQLTKPLKILPFEVFVKGNI